MNLRLQFRLIARRDTALKRAPQVLEKNMRSGLGAIGKRLVRSARARMRKDLGTSQNSLKYEITGQGLNLQLTVFSTLVQAFVDAYGLKRGIFPSFGVGTPLFKWSRRKMQIGASKRIGEKRLGAVPGRKRAKKLSPVVRSVRKLAYRRSEQGRLSANQRMTARNRDIKRVSFLVARYIYQNGIRPTHWNKKALEGNKTRIIRELKNALSRAVRELGT